MPIKPITTIINDGGSAPVYNPEDGSILDSFKDAVSETIQHADDVYGYKGGSPVYNAATDSYGSTLNPSDSSFPTSNSVVLPSMQETLTGMNPMINDASVYGKMAGSSVEDQLLWLINNDPDNATGWMESLIGLRAERENLQSARDWEKAMQDSRYQRAFKDLEAAGINPILAYQYVSGSASNVGAASYSGGTATSMAETKLNNKTKAVLGVVSALIGAMALVGKFLK